MLRYQLLGYVFLNGIDQDSGPPQTTTPSEWVGALKTSNVHVDTGGQIHVEVPLNVFLDGSGGLGDDDYQIHTP